MIQTKQFAFVAMIIATFIGASRAQAAEEQQKQPYVLVVGIDKYADQQIIPRVHAEDDAKGYYDVFTNQQYLGVDKDHIRLLLGSADEKRSSELATHENLVKELRWLGTHPSKNDVVVVVWIGQGAPLGERACYFASDSTFKDRAKNAVAAGEIETALEKLKSKRFCAFIDVNFKGFNLGPQESGPELNLSNFYREFLGNHKEEAKEDGGSATGRMIFLANAGLKPSLDLEHHGIFSQVVLEGLRGKADREGYEPDGDVTVDEMVEYVNKEVPELARQYGKTIEQKEQRDFIMGGRSANFVLTHNPTVFAKVHERLEKFEKLAQEQQLARKLVQEGKDYLTQMPKLESQRAIRKAYQKLVDGALTLEKFKEERTKILDDTNLSRSVALDYAAKILQAADLIQKEYVKKTNEGDLVASAIKGLYQRVEEKVPAELKRRLEESKNMNRTELLDLLADARQRLGKREDLANHKDIDYALQLMLLPLDPYTTYIDPETLGQFKRETQGNFSGIGIQIRVESARDMLVVVTPIKGSPAYKKGLKAGDIITTITREMDSEGNPLDKPEVISTKGLLIQDAVKKIIGHPGTKVKLTVEREGVDHPLEFELTRGTVEVESVLGVKRKVDDTKDPDSWDYVIDPKNQICYIRLTSFARNTARDLAQVLEYLRNTVGIKGLVLDLRFNPGGLLTSAVEISDMFIDDGLIVSIRPRNGREVAYTGEHEGSLLDFPMVCLVNGHSASGSEIVSACLQDHKRALIVGERSYGKGSVQNIQPFDEGEIKLTTASFWRPSGKNLNKSSTSGKESDEWGVIPDKTIKLSRKDRDRLEEELHKAEIIRRHDRKATPKEDDGTGDFKDVQLEEALKYLRGQIRIASSETAKRAG